MKHILIWLSLAIALGATQSQAAFRSSATTLIDGPGNHTATAPAGVQPGDYLGAVLIIDENANHTITVPSGWTLRVAENQNAPDGETFIYADTIATGSDSYVFGVASGHYGMIIVGAWSGRSGAITASTGSQSLVGNASPISIAATGVTAAAGDDIAVFSELDHLSEVPWSFSTISGYTLQQDLDDAMDQATGTLQTLDNVTAGPTGTLSLTATVSSGSASAGWGAIVVAIAAIQPGPVIATQPASTSVADPSTATFTVSATSTGGTLSYQWQDNSSGSFANVSSGTGATTASYTTSATDGSFNGRQYRVLVTDNNGTKTSNAATLTVTGAPTITSVTTNAPANGQTAFTITGTNLAGSGTSTVTLGGVSQAVTSQSSTALQITISRGTNPYGVGLDLVVTASNLGVSNTYTGITGLTPQAGWSYVNLASLAATGSRITATPDLAAVDQLAWDTVGGLVTIAADGTFSVDSSVSSFNVEAWTSGSGWGTQGLQTMN